MNSEDFNKLVAERLTQCTRVMTAKAGEYASDADRLHNFKKAGRMKDQDPVRALDGMWLKHRVSVDDMVERLCTDAGYVPDKALIAEKFGDNHNYLLLLEGLIEDRRSLLAFNQESQARQCDKPAGMNPDRQDDARQNQK